MAEQDFNRSKHIAARGHDGAATTQSSIGQGLRGAFYCLVNVEEHPEILPPANIFVSTRLSPVEAHPPLVPPPLHAGDVSAQLEQVLARLSEQRCLYARPWLSPRSAQAPEMPRSRLLHHFVQYMPTALVDGCWLQGGLRVATAHTELGASMAGMYQHQVRAFVADTGRHFVPDFRAVHARLSAHADDVASHSFAERADLLEAGLELPVFLLAIGQFPRSYGLEILGLQLAWQFLDLSSFGPDLIRDACSTYDLPPLGRDLADTQYLEKGREMVRQAVLCALGPLQGPELAAAWKRLMRGVSACGTLWARWLDTVQHTAPAGQPDPRQEMIELLRHKAPHARGFHGNRALGARKIDDFFDPQNFDGEAMLTALASSPWVKAGKSDKSALVNRLIGFGGPMLAVFTPEEQAVMRRWIDSLPEKGAPSIAEPGAVAADDAAPDRTAPRRDERSGNGSDWTRAELGAETRYRNISVRDLYHYLVNVELHPGIMPVAENFARERLERSMAMLWKGDRPIPSERYDPRALEAWVYEKHRQQVDSYRPPGVLPEASKDAFVEGTVQLAPLILIDGGWLQGMASPALIHTPIARMLLHVLVEELGEGHAAEHHANVYRNLLVAMGVDPPAVETLEFAHWSRLQDASFDVPTLWLSISCFPRHFMPEILGLNLAVELAGVGGPYMEARDTLRRFRLPTLFVDVHNAADNVSVGHSAWAMNTIKRYMDEVAERDGPHAVDRIWHRVWSGVRATMPQIGHARLVAHRLRQRFFGANATTTTRIFPL